ncbi:hypothetical protein P154DRAFT_105795 [Amniculicola lignicola CBS 123094]|uniref:Uncharacterized protein n=1 Tax=Amniculicola lignicola CBS 123094 TaxID=1392246 RepID=A0A6A5VVZ8_9PLEO|nr:hypothetical protein P154DRAFT_105795 [Amniculicola lignicola CBS 123094]
MTITRTLRKRRSLSCLREKKGRVQVRSSLKRWTKGCPGGWAEIRGQLENALVPILTTSFILPSLPSPRSVLRILYGVKNCHSGLQKAAEVVTVALDVSIRWMSEQACSRTSSLLDSFRKLVTKILCNRHTNCPRDWSRRHSPGSHNGTWIN